MYDDDFFHRDLQSSSESIVWRWILTAGRIYLLRWETATREYAVFREKDGNLIRCLQKHYKYDQEGNNNKFKQLSRKRIA
jgi:hypothetical protein